MTLKERYMQRLDILSQTLSRLEEAVEESRQRPESDTLRDGVIQRFEFCFELTWKTLKVKLEYEGFPDTATPRSIIKQAFQLGWVSDESDWLLLLDDRNQTSHTYNARAALIIYKRIVSQHLPLLKNLLHQLSTTP